jgi:hypothetical protein
MVSDMQKVNTAMSETIAISQLQQHLATTAVQLEEELSTIQFSLKKQLPLLPSTYDQVTEHVSMLMQLLEYITGEIDRLYLAQQVRMYAAPLPELHNGREQETE